MERSIYALILVLFLTGCSPFFAYVKRLDPYEIPISEQAWNNCPDLPFLSADTFKEVMQHKIVEANMYKDCMSKHSALKKILESLSNEQIIRITTPESKGSGS